jgi:hypothetical protein
MLPASLCALSVEEPGIWAEALARLACKRWMAIGPDQSRRLMCWWRESRREILF